MSSSRLSEGTVEVGLLDTILGLPSKFFLVCENTCNQCRTIVAAKTDEQHSKFGNLLFSGDCVLLNDVLERFSTLIIDSESLLIL